MKWKVYLMFFEEGWERSRGPTSVRRSWPWWTCPSKNRSPRDHSSASWPATINWLTAFASINLVNYSKRLNHRSVWNWAWLKSQLFRVRFQTVRFSDIQDYIYIVIMYIRIRVRISNTTCHSYVKQSCSKFWRCQMFI